MNKHVSVSPPEARQLDIIIPVYNESLAVVLDTIQQVRAAFNGQAGVQLIVVDDGSAASYKLSDLKDETDILFIQHGENRGYGAALKTGVRSGHANWIAITDADGTYPVADLPAMWAAMHDQDTVIGTRTGDIRQIPLLRRFPKAMLNGFASYMAGTTIPDLNSGLRIFSRALCERVWGLLPNGFSFTSTITMGAVLGGYRVRYQPINYYKRAGTSSIHPIHDTIRFFGIVFRLGTLFAPMKVFGPTAALFFVAGFVKGFLIDFPFQGFVGNASVMAMLGGIQIFMMGLLGQIMVYSRDTQAGR